MFICWLFILHLRCLPCVRLFIVYTPRCLRYFPVYLPPLVTPTVYVYTFLYVLHLFILPQHVYTVTVSSLLPTFYILVHHVQFPPRLHAAVCLPTFTVGCGYRFVRWFTRFARSFLHFCLCLAFVHARLPFYPLLHFCVHARSRVLHVHVHVRSFVHARSRARSHVHVCRFGSAVHARFVGSRARRSRTFTFTHTLVVLHGFTTPHLCVLVFYTVGSRSRYGCTFSLLFVLFCCFTVYLLVVLHFILFICSICYFIYFTLRLPFVYSLFFVCLQFTFTFYLLLLLVIYLRWFVLHLPTFVAITVYILFCLFFSLQFLFYFYVLTVCLHLFTFVPIIYLFCCLFVVTTTVPVTPFYTFVLHFTVLHFTFYSCC